MTKVLLITLVALVDISSTLVPLCTVNKGALQHKSSIVKKSITALELGGPPFQLERIDHVVIRCRNFRAMFDFYHRILGCTIDEPREEHLNRFGGALTHLRAGSCYIDLLAYDSNHLTKEGREFAAKFFAGGSGVDLSKLQTFSSDVSTMDHLCLRIEPFDEIRLTKYLKEENVEIVTSGDKRLGADGVGPAVYVRDPEGNVIELKGKPLIVDDTEKYSMLVVTNVKERNSSTPNKNHESTKTMIHDTKDFQSDDSKGLQEDNDAEAVALSSSLSSEVPLTPCNRICRYNSSFYDGQVCIGCFREAYEISSWQSMTPLEKSMTLLDAIDRAADRDFDGAITEAELRRQYSYWANFSKS